MPFEEPYHCQKDYITKVIEALKTKSNALLESPTGTGKTISFLCAAVAYIKKEREKMLSKKISEDARSDKQMNFNGAQNNPKEVPQLTTIIYCTRTHSQI